MHIKIICKECGTIIKQCKCFKCDRKIEYSVCDKCTQKNKIIQGEGMGESELLKIKHEFEKFYNKKHDVPYEEEIRFANICNLETRMQHDVSMIFYCGFLAGKKST